MELSEIQVTYSATPTRKKITSSKALEKYIRPAFKNIDWVETAFIICMASNGKVLGHRKIAEGSNSQCHISIKKVLQIALTGNANSIAIVHNHPSGNTKPSESDIEFMGKLISACDIIEVTLVDFCIITKTSFNSCR